jgi:hypothetical protein
MYRELHRSTVAGARFKVLATQTRLQALLFGELHNPLVVSPSLVAAFHRAVERAGFRIVSVRHLWRDGIRFGLLCWRADVGPVVKLTRRPSRL